jgi:hypothetical protein
LATSRGVHSGTESGKIASMKASASSLARQPVGLSLRTPHLRDLAALAPVLGFVELRARDVGTVGGMPLADARRLAGRWPLSLQASEIGWDGGLNLIEPTLEELARLIDLPRRRVSLALPMARETQVLTSSVSAIQEALGQPLLLELGESADALRDTPRLAELARSTHSRITLEPDRLLRAAVARARASLGPASEERLLWQRAMALALDVTWALWPSSVGQIRLGGFQAWAQPPGEHRSPRPGRDQRVSPPGWTLLRQTWEHVGPLPTALAWDTDLPGLAVLLDEVRLASELMAEVGADEEDAAGFDD